MITSKCKECNSILREVAVEVTINKENTDSTDCILFKTYYESSSELLFCDWLCYGRFIDKKFPPKKSIFHKW